MVLSALAVLVTVLGLRYAGWDTGEARLPGDVATALLRAVLLAALCLHVGELATARMARAVPLTPRPEPRSWARGAAWIGVGAAVGQLVLLAGTGSLVDGLTSPDLEETYGTRPGALALLEANGFLLAAVCAAGRRPGWAAVPLAAVILGEALRAHPETDTPEIGTALTVVHLTASALWAGGLVHVLRTMRVWRRTPGAGRALLLRYARVAVVLLVAVSVTGTFSTLRRLPLSVVFDSAYGRTLLVKLGLMVVVCALALVARMRLARDRRDARSAARPARAEVVVLVVVLLVSAVLTAVPVPVGLAG
ncbi:CopD family protein [Streptomyces sp. NPDC003077]|uniref:CopD family protein n=1 Tax=Streptomyces sp. NPDC003077 TaxID=3154443 RepID=UPI0033BC9C71